MSICLLISIVSIFILSILLYLSIRFNYKIKEKYSQLIKQLNNKLENKIQQKANKAEQDLASRSALLTDVSHEIRSPLHGIVSISEILSTKWENVNEEEKRKQIKVIFDVSVGLVKFVNDLLDFSKFSAGKMVFHFTELDLFSSIAEVIDYCKKVYLFDKEIFINFESKKFAEAKIYGDEARINQLIMNLFTNAIKYTEKGIIVAELKLVNHNGKCSWEFSLIDQGVGIPSIELKNIFKPFTRSVNRNTSKKVGSGLGLAICKQIVEAHGGEIWAENNGNKGSKFSFVIPTFKKKDLFQSTK